MEATGRKVALVGVGVVLGAPLAVALFPLTVYVVLGAAMWRASDLLPAWLAKSVRGWTASILTGLGVLALVTLAFDGYLTFFGSIQRSTALVAAGEAGLDRLQSALEILKPKQPPFVFIPPAALLAVASVDLLLPRLGLFNLYLAAKKTLSRVSLFALAVSSFTLFSQDPASNTPPLLQAGHLSLLRTHRLREARLDRVQAQKLALTTLAGMLDDVARRPQQLNALRDSLAQLAQKCQPHPLERFGGPCYQDSLLSHAVREAWTDSLKQSGAAADLERTLDEASFAAAAERQEARDQQAAIEKIPVTLAELQAQRRLSESAVARGDLIEKGLPALLDQAAKLLPVPLPDLSEGRLGHSFVDGFVSALEGVAFDRAAKKLRERFELLPSDNELPAPLAAAIADAAPTLGEDALSPSAMSSSLEHAKDVVDRGRAAQVDRAVRNPIFEERLHEAGKVVDRAVRR